MIHVENMRVAQIGIDSHEWGDEDDPKSDWRIVQEICCFSHREACEFILPVGEDDYIKTFKEAGLSEKFLKWCKEAQDEGYSYICFYS